MTPVVLPHCGPGGGRLRIGLMGGSFNPAHQGHRHVARLALRRLRLDEVWWLVSPQNPLKDAAGMAPLAERLAQARRIARHPRIRVLDLESRLGTRYTADTLAALRRRCPRPRFVWIMGADNLAQLPRWRRWPDIFRRMAVAVFDRPSYSFVALAGKAAKRFARFRLPSRAAGRLAARSVPIWAFLHTPLSRASATAIRRAAQHDGRSGNGGPARGNTRKGA